jgi:MFS family permease
METIKQYLETFKIRNVGLLVLARVFYSLTLYTTIFTLFLLKRGLDYWEIFLLESVLSAAIFIFEIPSGILADKFGRKKLVVLSVTLFALSTYIIAFSHSFFGFIIESFLYGLGVAAMSGTDSAIIYESLQQKDKTALSRFAFSLTNLTDSFAMVISLPVGGFLASYNLDLPIYVTCIPMTIAVILTLFMRETRIDRVREPTTKGLAKSSLKAVVKQHPYLVLLQVFLSLVFGAVFSLNYLNQPLFVEYHIPVSYFGFIMLAVNLLMTAAVLVTPVLQERLHDALLFFLTILLPGLLFIVLAIDPPEIFGVPLLGLILIVNSIRGPLYQTFINDQIQESERATILSMISFAGSLVGMCFKPIIGILTDIDHLHMTFMVFGILLTLLSFAVVHIIRRVLR